MERVQPAQQTAVVNYAYITNFDQGTYQHERYRSEKAPHVRLTPKTTNFHLTPGTRNISTNMHHANGPTAETFQHSSLHNKAKATGGVHAGIGMLRG
jgi:hypothetical protein